MKTNIQVTKDIDIHTINFKRDFLEGFKKSIPIILGYLPVSFTFGIIASGEGLNAFTAVLISIANFTSAGQFAGTNIIVANGAYADVATARTGLGTSKALYQLANPITQQLPISNLIAEPSGTLYVDNIYSDVDFYSTNATVAGRTFNSI